jgi:hypothetical protein
MKFVLAALLITKEESYYTYSIPSLVDIVLHNKKGRTNSPSFNSDSMIL